MAIKVPQSSFSAGELDPALRERTTLAKYHAGLATGRNVIVSKTGSIMSRPGRKHFANCRYDNSAVQLYSPNNSGYLLEWGDLYVRTYTFDSEGFATLQGDTAHALTAADVPNMNFDTSGNYVYVFCSGKATLKFNYTTQTFTTSANIFDIPVAPTNGAITANGAPTGYYVDYAVTYMKGGEESLPLTIAGASTYKLPIAAGQSNTVAARVNATPDSTITEMRVYRRPQNGGAFGYVGSTSYIAGTPSVGSFEDIGGAADYTHSPPSTVVSSQAAVTSLHGRTGAIYQQRLLITETTDLEAIYASRPGFQNNFLRDYPLGADSALKFKSGTSGYAKVLRMIESDGLVVFTANGVFLSVGSLSPTNIHLDKKGKWRINEDVPPLPLPGGVFFVDSATNSIRNLVWSTELASYNGQEVSIFSNHLFRNSEITSWAFQEGAFPLLWVVFEDGTYASFTYDFDQEMRAWTRHDSLYDVESVAGTGKNEQTFFVMKRGTRRHIEITVPRLTPVSFPDRAAAYQDDSEADKGISIAAMDGMFSKYYLVSYYLTNDTIYLEAVDHTDYSDGFIDGDMYLYVTNDAIFPDPGIGTVGTIFRYFDDDGCAIDLEVIARTDDNRVTVRPTLPFPATTFLVGSPRLYETFNVISGLPSELSLSGQPVSVIVDGYVVGSPNNNDQNYPYLIPSGTDLTLPNEMRGAIIHIGWPFTADVETLDIDTVEQAPTVIESMTVNKLYIKVHESSGLYVASRFPEDDNVTDMVSLDQYGVDYSQTDPIVGNRYKAPETKRVELTLPGDWSSNGRVALRQVDPLHFEILSIITDLEVNQRSDR